MSFYEDKPDRCLRFGDVICGFHVPVPRTDDPRRDLKGDLAIHILQPDYLAVMTPCCSIEQKTVSLAPLVRIRPAFLQNPHFAEDLTRINRKVQPENSVSPTTWQVLPAARRAALLASGEGYTFMECYVYDGHSLLRRYTLSQKQGNREVGHYLVEFRSIFRVDCARIVRNENAPEGLKLLQLSISARSDLRDKLAYYFGRVPEEDKPVLAER